MKKVKFLSLILAIILMLNVLLPIVSLAVGDLEEKIENKEEINDKDEQLEDEKEEINGDKKNDNKEETSEYINNLEILSTQGDELKNNEIQLQDTKSEKTNLETTINQTMSDEESLKSINKYDKVKYSSHIQDYGWEKDFSKTDGEISGTEGKSKRIEAIKIALGDFEGITKNANIKYQVHVEDYGWMDWKKNGEIAGTQGESKKIEAIKIELEGLEGYDIKYRVHVQDIGWTNWVQNGESAGTVGKSKRIEAIQIKVVECPIIKMEYVYNESNNTVTAIINSNKQLANTKPTWTLSEDNLSYSKTFSENMDYITQVQDIDGNIVDINIKISMGPEIEIEYLYDPTSNTITAIMHSNRQLANTKPTWTLSEDRLSYSKTFSENMNYVTSVTDINGNTTVVQIQVTEIIEVEYIHNGEDNTVTVIISSGKELANTKPTWNFSSDKKSFSKIYSENMSYETLVTDIDGNVIVIPIQITQIIEIVYAYNIENNTVIATICSDRELKDTKPTWILSDDRKSYSKVYNENKIYRTTVIDSNGTVINVEINITEVDDKAPEITQEYIHNGDGTVTVILHSNERLGNTKPTWTLSEDELSYSKIFSENQTYETKLQDFFGNEVSITLRVLISNFESLDETKYPGYRTLLQQIQNQHPEWIITIKYTGLDWNTVIENEYGFSDGSPRSLTQSPYLNEWKSAEDNNKYDVSQSWYRASKSAIAYMMDPRNSLEEAWVFQFQDLGSSAGTRKNIEKMVVGTFLNNDSIIDTILAVAKEQGISPFHLVSRMIQEQYKDGTGIMNGYEYNGRKVYNLFNINVSGDSAAGIEEGAKYAYDRHWFTPETCIIGSAEFLKKNYISKGQSTLYFQKYNVVDKSNLYNHQYMQNIRAANDEGNTIYKSYRDNGLLDSQFEFVIPVYENMPATACPRPKT